MYVDSTLYPCLNSTRLPEYLILYEATDSSFVALDSVCIMDTMSPRHKYRVQYTSGGRYCDEHYNIYEAYFNRPCVVRDSFYVGGTCYNNLYDYVECAMTHPLTEYLCLHNGSIYDNVPCGHIPEYIKQRCTYLYPYDTMDFIYPTMDSSVLEWKWYDFNGGFLCLFPIFDTVENREPDTGEPDSCYAVEGLRVLGIESGRATLTWEIRHGQTAWEIAHGPSGTPPESCAYQRATSRYATLSGLDSDTWYVAYIRADCDTLGYSEWSDSVRFYVSTDGHIGDVIVTATDANVRIFPNPARKQLNVISSFQLTQVELYDLQGQRLLQQPASGIHAVLEVSALSPGRYLVAIHTQSGSTTKKLVIQ